ncbi:hypothetical protein B0H14DRAFT_3857189 [Mycena olivaceomarginata]|nr:hypothetical protein B0H14DRAFT_3857189 [Mycena olivaceomarginata]
MPPKLVFQHQVISGGNGDQTGEYVPSEWTTHMCDRRDCNNHENLTKCSQCKSALYCSKECQKTDWKNHKPYCQMVVRYPPKVDLVTGGEPPLQRHLRLWNARFEDSLMFAAIVALDLYKRPENIDNLGLVITLRPRAHPEAGSRFKLVSARTAPLSIMMAIMVVTQRSQARGPASGPNLADLHQQHRDEQRAKTGGMEDYAAVMVIANNDGSLPGGLVSTEIRFKPVSIQQHLVRSPQLTDPTLDWYASLEVSG